MSYAFDEIDYISGKPILMGDGYYHIEWEHKNGEKTITVWGVKTFEQALLSIKHILRRVSK